MDCLNGDVNKYLWVDALIRELGMKKSIFCMRTTEPRGRYGVFPMLGGIGFVRGQGCDIGGPILLARELRADRVFVRC